MDSAVKAGADRLELCSNLGVGGGTTPSLGLLKAVKRAVPGVPIMVGTALNDSQQPAEA
jgi:copper homeostasis protein